MASKKVGIVTNFKNCNYGSVLQSYALQTIINDLGYDCENLAYDFTNNEITTASLLTRIIKNPNLIYQKIKRIKNGQDRRWDNFVSFLNNYIKVNPRVFRSIGELKNTNNIYNAFICGSDQIWAPNQFNELYYLSFVNNREHKIAYAPSIGLPSIPDNLKYKMSELIKGIKYLSIRERQGADIVKELTGIDIPVVLDPTLLFNKNGWLNIAKESKINKPYILCYFLGENPIHRKMADEYSKKTGLKKLVLPFVKDDYLWGDILHKSAGPMEFINLINNANIVFTDSYHGLLFSINFNKQFRAFMRFDSNDILCQNSRIINVLNTFNLQNALVNDHADKSINYSEIDFLNANKKLEDMRKFSLDFLQNSLSESLK